MNFSLFANCDAFSYEKVAQDWENNTQKPTNIPNSKKPIGVKWMYKTKGAEEGVMEAFKTLFSEKGGWRPGFEEISFEVLEDVMAKNLEGVFLKKEVLGTLMELNGDKTPSLDGFSMTFWSFNWEFVKHKV